MRSSLFATGSTASPRLARPRLFNQADRCAIRTSSPPPTSMGWQWCSPVGDTSGIDMSPFREEPLVTLATFDTEFEASLARGALEAIGIRALVPGEHSGNYGRGRAGQFQ